MKKLLDDKQDGSCWNCRKPLKTHTYEQIIECYRQSWAM